MALWHGRRVDRDQLARMVAALDDETLAGILARQSPAALAAVRALLPAERARDLLDPLAAPTALRAGADHRVDGADRELAPFADAVSRAAAFAADEPLALRALDAVGRLVGKLEIRPEPAGATRGARRT